MAVSAQMRPGLVPAMPLLAQSPDRVDQATQQVLWAVAMILVAIVVVVVVALVLRRLLLKPPDQTASRGFTLAEMRRLHEQGELSDEEWEAARSALLAHTRAEANRGGEGGHTGKGDTPATAPLPPEDPLWGLPSSGPAAGTGEDVAGEGGTSGDRPGEGAHARPPRHGPHGSPERGFDTPGEGSDGPAAGTGNEEGGARAAPRRPDEPGEPDGRYGRGSDDDAEGEDGDDSDTNDRPGDDERDNRRPPPAGPPGPG